MENSDDSRVGRFLLEPPAPPIPTDTPNPRATACSRLEGAWSFWLR